MPLSTPVDREHIHTRTVECRGYRRADGLWDIEGHLVDTKTYGFDNQDRGRVEAGEPVHEMRLRLTIDDAFLIHEAEATTEYGPYRICGDIAPNFALLKGLTIGPGWRRGIQAAVGGTKGCTHLVEMLGPMATAAFQTIWPFNAKRRQRPEGQRPAMMGTCHAYAEDSAISRRLWPDYFDTGKTEAEPSADQDA
ncbi:MAG: DUF2889 domain-containing protein [Rhodospirillaceae bacterium]|jgi:hypothetical protein|nr:DUF2889 domain-containing protein [Rhodospirillaceae bacterium]MBT6116775.1 DUF2889 domain-containing protein [Rhodospirillaceae bacterium]